MKRRIVGRLILPVKAPNIPPAAIALLMLFMYLAVHLGVRLLEGTTLRWDESEQTLFSQQLALGYNDQPPIYTWLLRLLIQLTDVSLVSVYCFKALVLASIYIGLYALVRRLTIKSLVLPAALSLLATPYFAWSALIDGAHTLLVSAFVPPACLLALRVLERPTAIGHIALGVVFALGFLAKYSFAILAIALVISIATVPTYRVRLRDPRWLLTIVAGALVVLPHSCWVIDHWQVIRERPMLRGGIQADEPFGIRVWHGLMSLASTTVLTVGSLVIALLVFFRTSFLHACKRSASSPQARLLGRWLTVIVVMLVLLVFLGVSKFRIHWLIPAMVLVPAFMFARFVECPPSVTRRRAFISFIVIGMVAVAGLRLVGVGVESRPGGKYWAQDQMHASLAKQVASAGLEEAAFIGDHPIACGNLRTHFPQARVVCIYYPAFEFADLGVERPCCIIWDATFQSRPWPPLESWLRSNGLFDRIDWSTAMFAEVPVEVPGYGLRRIGLARLRDS